MRRVSVEDSGGGRLCILRLEPHRIGGRVIIYVLVFIEVAQLNVTARDYLRDVRPIGQDRWVDGLLTADLLLGAVIIVVHIIYGRRMNTWRSRSVGISAYVAIAYVLVCALSAGLLSTVSTSYWNSSAEPAAYITVTLGSVTLPTLVVFIQLLALPSARRARPRSPRDHAQFLG